MSRRVLQLAFLAAIVAVIWNGRTYFDQWHKEDYRA